MSEQDFRPLLARLADGATLTEADAETFFEACLDGRATDAQLAAALTAIRLRGETVGELAACARVLRRASLKLEGAADAIDLCGTGGDGQHTLNISTAAALVVAGAGVRVAKHGGKAATSKSGSSDVLSELGVDLQAGPEAEKRALDQAGVCFMFAPAHHPALARAVPVRTQLGFRTLFNLLGPLISPASVERQVIGVPTPRHLDLVAGALQRLGAKRAWVVHGDGLDELTTTGPTDIVELRDGALRRFRITPQAVGLAPATIEDLRGGDPAHNAVAIRRLLDGATGPYRDVVLLNAAAGLLVAERVETLAEGIALGAAAIDEGRARQALDRLVENQAS
ncbi:anthranilate phosphoribosyltransferase [Brevundimonas sp. 2R-24]|uniref:Anthranilate phosphoribosyltransferase n=1 Tax=Peiella sedimenti TaxID=3061083 RepID=A0ABT8SIW8_9CAUL|nr:anthranilate phosphoribosyltransferase [Caulobacteraceae bacterium XZ-24]